MSVPTLNCMPVVFAAADTVLVQYQFANYPNTDWTARMYLSLNGAAGTQFYATNDGTFFLFTLPSAATILLSPGIYQYAVVVTDGTQIANPVGAQGNVTVIPSYASQQTPTANMLMLAALDAAILALLNDPYARTNFNGQSFEYKDMEQLRLWRTQLQAAVEREQNRIYSLRTGKDPYRIRTRFETPMNNNGPFWNWPWPYCAR